MNFKITRSQFLEGLKTVQNIVPSKGALQIIQNIMLEAKEKSLYLTTTDLDISIRCVVDCDVVNEGATTLPAKLLLNTIAKAPEGVIEVEVDAQDRAVIKAGPPLQSFLECRLWIIRIFRRTAIRSSMSFRRSPCAKC